LLPEKDGMSDNAGHFAMVVRFHLSGLTLNKGIIMTKSGLRYHVENTGSHFFDRTSMRFFGDTMANYYVPKKPVQVGGVNCWALQRVHPVKGGLSGTTYFDCKTFNRVHPVK
jgi:hypothetical protein